MANKKHPWEKLNDLREEIVELQTDAYNSQGAEGVYQACREIRRILDSDAFTQGYSDWKELSGDHVNPKGGNYDEELDENRASAAKKRAEGKGSDTPQTGTSQSKTSAVSGKSSQGPKATPKKPDARARA